MREYARTFPSKEANQAFLNISENILLLLLEQGWIPRKLKVAFDFHKELYYGEKDNPHIIGILAEKGTKTFKWHTCAIILKGIELQIGSKMIQKGEKKEPFIRKRLNI